MQVTASGSGSGSTPALATSSTPTSLVDNETENYEPVEINNSCELNYENQMFDSTSAVVFGASSSLMLPPPTEPTENYENVAIDTNEPKGNQNVQLCYTEVQRPDDDEVQELVGSYENVDLDFNNQPRLNGIPPPCDLSESYDDVEYMGSLSQNSEQKIDISSLPSENYALTKLAKVLHVKQHVTAANGQQPHPTTTQSKTSADNNATPESCPDTNNNVQKNKRNKPHPLPKPSAMKPAGSADLDDRPVLAHKKVKGVIYALSFNNKEVGAKYVRDSGSVPMIDNELYDTEEK